MFLFFSCSFQVFGSLKVGSKARDEIITSGESSLSLVFMLYFIEGNVLFNFKGKFVVESALDFFSTLCYTCLCLCLCFVSHMS